MRVSKKRISTMNDLADLNVIMQYLTMNKAHTVQKETALGNIIEISMDENMNFYTRIINSPASKKEQTKVEFQYLMPCVRGFRMTPANDKDNFENRMEEIRSLVEESIK